MPIRVLFMQSQSYFGADSEIHAQLMRYFDRSDCEVFAACTTEEQPHPATNAPAYLRAIPNLHLHPVNFGFSRSWSKGSERLELLKTPKMLLSLARFIRRHKIQVIHATEKPRDAFYGAILAKLTGAKLIVHMHISYGHWMNKPLKTALKLADGIIGVSDFTANSVVEGGYPKEKVYSVLNALALSSSRWNEVRDGAEIREEFGILPEAPVLGIVARIFNWKGHTSLVEALAKVRDEFPSVRLLIVGEADNASNYGGGDYLAELKAHIKSLHLEENVIFTGYRPDIPELMASMDVYSMPSWEEPFGMVYVEAMSQKKPVVCWANGGPKQIVVEGETGFLVPPKDVPAFAEAVCRLLRDPELRQKFGAAGRERVETCFASERMCRDVVEVYRSVLSRGKR